MTNSPNPYLDLYDAAPTQFAAADDGARIAFKRVAARSPSSAAPLILVSGFSRLKREWDDFAHDLLADRDVIVIDNRGLDESVLENLDSITTHHRFAEDVLAVARDAGLKGFHLAGVSMGGYISQYVMLKLHPDSGHYQPHWKDHGLELLSATLICCAPKRPYSANSTSPLFKLLDAETAKAQTDLDAGLIDETEFHRRIQFASWVLSLTEEWAVRNPEKINALVAREVLEVQAGRKPDAVLARHRNAGHGFDVIEELKLLRPESSPQFLVVHGDMDALISNELGGDLFAQLLPNARYLLLKGVGHSTYLMDDGATAREMRKFMEDVERMC